MCQLMSVSLVLSSLWYFGVIVKEGSLVDVELTPNILTQLLVEVAIFKSRENYFKKK